MNTNEETKALNDEELTGVNGGMGSVGQMAWTCVECGNTYKGTAAEITKIRLDHPNTCAGRGVKRDRVSC